MYKSYYFYIPRHKYMKWEIMENIKKFFLYILKEKDPTSILG